MFTKHTDLLITARSAVSSGSGMAQIPSPLRVPHQLQFCPPSRDASRGPQAPWPSGEALGATLAAPRNVWDTRPGSELSSGFSLRLTHCPPAPPTKGSVCHRSLPSWGLCTTQRHAQGCSLNHPLEPRQPAGLAPNSWFLSVYSPQTPDTGRPSSRGLRAKAIPSGPPRAAHVPRGESEQQGGGKGVQGLTWRGTSGTKGSSAYQTWSSEEERDSAQKPIQREE